MEKVEAVPMCDSPVTLGRGSMMTNGSRDGSTGAWKYPLSIQVLYHASSTWRGSYVAGRVFVVIARRLISRRTQIAEGRTQTISFAFSVFCRVRSAFS